MEISGRMRGPLLSGFKATISAKRKPFLDVETGRR